MKYIIEIAKEYEEYFKGILICGIADGKFSVDVIAREDLEELTSDYINEHYGVLQDTAYQKGLHDGESKRRYCNEYQRGLNDAWEAARKIVEMSDPPYWELFDEYKENLFGKISASEAIEKLKAYEDKQKADDEIKVGDEVRHDRGWTAVVTSIDNVGFSVMDLNGEVGSYSDISKFEKTGRHFDIASILEDMRND